MIINQHTTISSIHFNSNVSKAFRSTCPCLVGEMTDSKMWEKHKTSLGESCNTLKRERAQKQAKKKKNHIGKEMLRELTKSTPKAKIEQQNNFRL